MYLMQNTVPEWLKVWQPQASEKQLQAFVQNHALILNLLEDSWRRFFEQTSLVFANTNLPTSTYEPYAPNVSIEQLTHSPISQAEMAAFLEAFDTQSTRNRPFGDNVQIEDKDWELI